MKISNDTIGNRTRELPACSPVPQPTAPPCAPFSEGGIVRAGDYIFFNGKRNENPLLGSVKTVKSVSERMSYIVCKVDGVISLYRMRMHQVRRKVMIQKTNFMKKLPGC